ncbi:MAG TPA: type II toxin-antitoxin system VapC family toxin [Candidatus Angelobacter sp.]|nr:type II toxin-antitoxin system VapC family toxin [Candidatus Angelobacter sp.]
MIVAVVDTHALLWSVVGRTEKLGVRALKAFEGAQRNDGSALIHIPTIVLSECLSIFESGRVRIQQRFDDWVQQLDRHRYFSIEELRTQTILKSFELPLIRDPFDRMIVATALDLELPLISADLEIRETGYVEILWD